MKRITRKTDTNRGQLIIGLLISALITPCLCAGTWSAASSALADVATAISLASDGDTVTVPAGTSTWSAQLTVTKNITIQGEGIGKTIIIDNSPRGRGDQHLIYVSLTKERPLFRLTGMEFKLGTVTGSQPYGTGLLEFHGNSTATQNPLVVGMTSNFRVDHCKLDRLNGLAMGFHDVLGVVDHIEFIGGTALNPATGKAIQPLEVEMAHWGGQDWGNGSWADDPYWGSNKFLFIEDSSFTSPSGEPAIDSFEGARMVVRHSTFMNAAVTNHGTEGQGRGAKQLECYENSFNSSSPGIGHQFRSGSFLSHDNNWGNFTTSHMLYVYRAEYPKIWGYASGTIAYDDNAGLVGSGTHTGGNGSRVLTDANHTFAANYDGVSEGVLYVIKNLDQKTVMPNTSASMPVQSYIASTTAHSATDAGNGSPSITWNSGNRYEIWKIRVVLDQAGQGKGRLLVGGPTFGASPAQPATYPQTGYPLEPCYSWNNVNGAGQQIDAKISHDQPNFKEGRDYFNRTQKLGYTPYIYPHPLTGPLPPSNLQVTQQ